MATGVLALFAVRTLAAAVVAGPLDPPGVPGSTLQRLSDVPPSWHQTLQSNNGGAGGCGSARFECVMGGAAVLDHETGLVWQRTPSLQADVFGLQCEITEIGGRYGWHVPTHVQLRSLLDTSTDHLPDGHPFIGAVDPGIQDTYWTSSLFGSNAFVVDFDAPGTALAQSQGGAFNRTWCVRGGIEIDVRT
jgi:hypothetical protein